MRSLGLTTHFKKNENSKINIGKVICRGTGKENRAKTGLFKNCVASTFFQNSV